MLNEGLVFATIAVKDMESAKKFYGGTLGLSQVNENPGGVTYQSGGGKLFVYQSPTGGTNQATSATWEVADVEAAVADLKNKGIDFEHYEVPGATVQGDIHTMDGMRAAWFKDPDGNILCVSNAH